MNEKGCEIMDEFKMDIESIPELSRLLKGISRSAVIAFINQTTVKEFAKLKKELK